MAIPRRIHDLLNKHDFDSIEVEWLAQLEEEPENLDFFAGVARALVGQAQEKRAKNLLEMLDETLVEQKDWQTRLNTLKRVGDLLFKDGAAIHKTLLSTLEKLYGSHSNLPSLIEAVGLQRPTPDPAATWEKVDRLVTLVLYDLGTVVFMEGKGAGRIADVNLGLSSFRVEIAGMPKITVGFKAAGKVLQKLAPDHVLYRKLTAPAELKALALSDPPELLRIVLTSYSGPVLATDIKRDLTGIVEESRWNTFWTAARKHSQVIASTSGKQTYTWAASNEAAVDRVWKEYQRAEPRKRIELYRRDGARDPELARRMEEDLIQIATQAMDGSPGLAIEIFAALEKQGRTHDEMAFSPRKLLAESNPGPVLVGIEDRLLRERMYNLLRETREDWPSHFLAALSREDDPRTIELLISALKEHSPVAVERFYDSAIASPAKLPGAFTWLVETAAEDEALRKRNPLRLFQHILSGLLTPELTPFRLRLLAQCESGGTLVRLLPHLTEEQAAQAADAVHRAAGLEPYRRDDLNAALEIRFASLRKEAVQPLYALAGSIEAKRAELQHIATKEIPANRKAIEEARAMGDLRENFEYKSARQRHEYLTARAGELQSQLNRSKAIELENLDTSEVRLGCAVELQDAAGNHQTLAILGPWESDPEAGVISYESELGKALIGRRPEAIVDVGGQSYTVLAIRAYRPVA